MENLSQLEGIIEIKVKPDLVIVVDHDYQDGVLVDVSSVQWGDQYQPRTFQKDGGDGLQDYVDNVISEYRKFLTQRKTAIHSDQVSVIVKTKVDSSDV